MVIKLTGMEHSQRTEEDIKTWFNRAGGFRGDLEFCGGWVRVQGSVIV